MSLLDLARVRKIDLGSGPKPRAGHLGLDSGVPVGSEWPGVLRFDVTTGVPWPFEDGQIDELYASHFIEHVPASSIMACRLCPPGDTGFRHPLLAGRRYEMSQQQDALCWVFEEAWRVAAAGASFRLRWPSLLDERDGTVSLLPFRDPTHRRFIPRDQLHYFSSWGRKEMQVESYGLTCDWQIESEGQASLGACGFEYDVTLRKRA